MGHRIVRAEPGSVWFRPRILGRPGHVLATAAPGAHAILAAREHVAALQALTWIGFQADGHVFRPGAAAEAVLACVHAAATGAPLPGIGMTATSDTRFYDLCYGIPALCHGANARGMRSPSEAVELIGLRATTEIVALVVAEWRGLGPRA